MERNWAGNVAYGATSLARPTSLEEVSDLVIGHERVRALGSRHSFSDIADTSGVLISLADLPRRVEIDTAARTVVVDGGANYGQVVGILEDQGWALANLASLPHISIAGAVATGTHGSGDRNTSLSAAVAAIEFVSADGTVQRMARGDEEFDGAVVALGALGVVIGLTLDIEPTFAMSQSVFTGLSWESVESDFDQLTGAGYSVSLFTDWGPDGCRQVWVKSRGAGPTELLGGAPAVETMHMLPGVDPVAVTPQFGVPGSWLDRLPHFQLGFTPSNGREIQSEWLLPRSAVPEAIARLRRLEPRLRPLLQTGELRTVAADGLWLSGAYGRDTVGLHFTWVLDVPAVEALLPAVDDALIPLGGRPHWGKRTSATAADLAPLYPRFADFLALRDRFDPERRFGNGYLERVLGF